jgi:hypothetical protein
LTARSRQFCPYGCACCCIGLAGLDCMLRRMHSNLWHRSRGPGKYGVSGPCSLLAECSTSPDHLWHHRQHTRSPFKHFFCSTAHVGEERRALHVLVSYSIGNSRPPGTGDAHIRLLQLHHHYVEASGSYFERFFASHPAVGMSS